MSKPSDNSPDLPPASKRRQLLEEQSPRLAELGRALSEAGRWGEALECLQAAGDDQGISQIKDQALEEGDLFFWRQALKALGQAPDGMELARLKERAQAKGKQAFAQQAEQMMAEQEAG